ncbi:energy transducer TonB [Aliarcobacter skirrowii]|uniref:energy transducer TonB n=1 Tax=Aliarcobacter skirrowii TaxID=28200 RepID=UPI0029AB69FA|nr:energy transducer TonB [Aliarcobacter skirrowii]MDX4057730.1 energy transducer TonB [Aliarcobacter skirrowii]
MKNNRYIKSLFISSTIYLAIAAPIFISFSNTPKTVDIKKDVHTVTKISLSNIPIQEKVIEEIVEEEVVEKIIEKPAKKVVKKEIKKQKPKKDTKPKEKPKKIVEKKEVQEKITTADSVNQVKAAEIEDLYLGKIKNTIERYKTYPRNAKRLHHQGVVKIAFDVLLNGKITNIRIIENSKYKTLDKATIDLLEKIGSFDPIPNELMSKLDNKSNLSLEIPVEYQIN